jgi:hypothetical protein
VQGSGLQTLKPYTNFLPIENQERRSTRGQLASGQEIPPFPARRSISPIRLTEPEPAPMSASPSQLS